MSDEKQKDPWDGWPDTPWNVNGYLLDDAICDLLMKYQSKYSGVARSTAEEALNRLLEQVRSRLFDQKVEVHLDDPPKGE